MIEAAREMVQDEFDRTYWLLDVEGDDGTSQVDGNITVSRSFADTKALTNLYTGAQVAQNQQHL